MDKIAAYPIWFAQYDTDSPKLEYPICIWQYSNQGTISGIKEPTDLNIMFIQKNDQPE
jgi:GH25 family lysozyme M1 (1,4-beta-N-acetylmuramidase)